MSNWTCNKCGRSFARKNQSHTCKKYDIEHLFSGKPQLKDLFDTLIKKLKSYVPIRVDAISFAINLISRIHFGMVTVLKESLKVEFQLPYRIQDPRINKIAKMGDIFIHVVLIKEKEDVDQQLLNWLIDAFKFRG